MCANIISLGWLLNPRHFLLLMAFSFATPEKRAIYLVIDPSSNVSIYGSTREIMHTWSIHIRQLDIWSPGIPQDLARIESISFPKFQRNFHRRQVLRIWFCEEQVSSLASKVLQPRDSQDVGFTVTTMTSSTSLGLFISFQSVTVHCIL